MFSAIFDMDGVVVDNGEFHYLAWKEFCGNYKIPFFKEKFRTTFFGRINEQILPDLFGSGLTAGDVKKLGDEKEALYRKIYKNEIKPLKGLPAFLNDLKDNSIPIAMATSAPPENVEFVLNCLDLAHYFDFVVDGSMVARGKPDPEIYLKAAHLLGTVPGKCIVFEDSLSGTKAAFGAGAKVVGLSTSLSKEEHKFASYVFSDFSEISVNFIREEIFN